MQNWKKCSKKWIASALAGALICTAAPLPGYGRMDPVMAAEVTETGGIPSYTSPSTTWDFDTYGPAAEGENVPVVSGTAVYDETLKNIKFGADTKNPGEMNLTFGTALQSTLIEVEFDAQFGKLGKQTFCMSLTDDAETALLSYQVHPYATTADYPPSTLVIGGTQVAAGNEITNALGLVSSTTADNSPVHYKITLDFNARTVTFICNDATFSGKLSDEAFGNLKKISMQSARTGSTVAARATYVDNLTVAESESQSAVAEPDVVKGYQAAVYTAEDGSTLPYRYYVPEGASGSLPVIVYLHGQKREGTDNVSQMYHARYLFDAIKSGDTPCILIAPQCPDSAGWTDTDEDSLAELTASAKNVMGLLESLKTQLPIDSNQIYLAGNDIGAAACYDLALHHPDEFAALIAIDGVGSLDEAKINALAEKNIGVWAFGCCESNTDAPAERKIVAALQKAGASNVFYTEFPASVDSIQQKAAEAEGLLSWLFERSLTGNAEKPEKTVDLVLFAGQSNMAGRGDADEATVCPAGWGYEYHAVTGEGVLSTVTEPFGKWENNSEINDAGSDGVERRSGDLVSSLMKAYYEKTQAPIVGVQASRGGTSTSWWKNSGRQNEAIARYKEAEEYLTASGYTIRNKFLVWCQGEADADNNVASETYKTNTQSIFDNIKTGTGISQIFLVETGHYNYNYRLEAGQAPAEENLEKDENYKRINAAQRELSEANEDITTVSTYWTADAFANMRDQYHYYQSVYNTAGAMAGHNIAAFYDAGIEALPVPDSSSGSGDLQDVVTYDKKWTFDTADEVSADQTAKDIPVASDAAEWDETNQNVKFNCYDKYNRNAVLTLTPANALEGVVTAEFDLFLGALKNKSMSIVVNDAAGQSIVTCDFNVYAKTASLVIHGTEVAAGTEIVDYMHSQNDDGIKSSATHFAIEIDTQMSRGSVTITNQKNSKTVTYVGNIASETKIGSIQWKGYNSNSVSERPDYLDNLSVQACTPARSYAIAGPTQVKKKLGGAEASFELKSMNGAQAKSVSWSVSGASDVTIDANTGVMTIPETAGTGAVEVKATVYNGTEYSVITLPMQIKDFAKPAKWEANLPQTMNIGDRIQVNLQQVLNEDGEDLTAYAALCSFTSSDTDVIEITENGTMTAKAQGTATITCSVTIEKLSSTQEITGEVRAGCYELVSSDAQIDVSAMISYGASTYRVYSSDGSYKSVAAVDGKVANDTGAEVIVVPEYKFNLTNAGKDGYVKVGMETGDLYAAGNGYGFEKSYTQNETGYRLIQSAPFYVNVPQGNYDISFTKTCSGRMDFYCNGYQFFEYGSAGQQNRATYPIVYTSEQVKIDTGLAKLYIAGSTGKSADECVETITLAKVPDSFRKAHVFLAGDSTVANYFPIDETGDDLASDKIMMTGWGMEIGKFLSDQYVTVNLAEQGATANSWYDSHFESMLYYMESGDTMLVDFGINDGNKNVGTDNTKEYIEKMAKAAREKGVRVILVSPVFNYKYRNKTYFTYNASAKINEEKAFAKQIGAEFIDLNKYTKFYLNVSDMVSANEADYETELAWLKLNYQIEDELHLSQWSALLCASFIAADMEGMGYKTTDFACEYADLSSIADGNVKGELSGEKRTYSVAAAKEFIKTLPTDAELIEDPDDVEREILYQQDFESFAEGETGGWTSPAGKVSVAADATQGINHYIAATSDKGAARSSYFVLPETITDNFVLEADFKSDYFASNVSAFEVLEQKSSLYMNHGCYSNAKYIFKMNRPAGEYRYVLNNAVSDSGLSLDGYSRPAVLTSNVASDPWLHIKAVGDFSKGVVKIQITSLDGVVYYQGVCDMSEGITGFSLLALLSPSNTKTTCLDNIVISRAVEQDLAFIYHTAEITCGLETFGQYVLDGKSVVNVPDVSDYGAYFLGWKVNGSEKLYTTAELESLPVTADVSITAEISADYVEELASVEFKDFPANGRLVMGADGDTYADNRISLAIVGTQGTSFVTDADARVEDYEIQWKFDGFRIMGGRPTGETGDVYCDSYGLCEVTEKAQSAVNFKLKNTSENYYGRVTAAVTYHGKTIRISKPLALLADSQTEAGVYLPKAYHVSDYNLYDGALEGTALASGDALLGGFMTAGSDQTAIMLASDETGRYLSAERACNGNSSYIYNEIGALTGQTIFAQDIRFHNSASILYTGGTNTSADSTAFKLEMKENSFRFNGEEVCSAEMGKWYHIVICAEPTTQKCWAKIYSYNADGVYTDDLSLGKTEETAFLDAECGTGNFYRINMDKNAGTVDFNRVNIYTAKAAEDSFTFEAPQTLQIPADGAEAVSQTLRVSAKTTDGDAAMGAVWQIADSFAEGVAIMPDPDNPQQAALTVTSEAAAGDLQIKVTVGGVSKTVTIKLIGTKDGISFRQAVRGIKIPDTGTAESVYQAQVIDKDAQIVEGRAVTYSLYDAEGVNKIMPEGISLDSDTGKLCVEASAKPMKLCVVAESMGSANEKINRKISVSVYNWNFSFTGSPAENQTAVAQTDLYGTMGYGITGTAEQTQEGLTGAGFGFRLQADAGEVYEITATWKGTLNCEYVDSYFTGFPQDSDALTEKTFRVALVGDGVLDFTFAGSGVLAAMKVEKITRESGEKPSWWTIGDSTVQQNGSWGYTIAQKSTSDLTKYPELAEAVGTFYNSGQAGRQHKSYYTEGLLNNVLISLKPGDVVSISGMGTNDSASTKELFKQFDNYYIDAVIAMGGRVILGSYTPAGNYGATAGKVYDADTMTFRGKRTDLYDEAIREVYKERAGEPEILGFVDIGQMADTKMTADVKAVYDAALLDGATESAARVKANEKAAEMMAWWKDYNHYYDTFSNYILPDITKAVAAILAGQGGDLSDGSEKTEATEKQSERTETTEKQSERTESTEEQSEKTESTEKQSERTESTEKQSERTETTEKQSERTESTEKQSERTETTEKQSERTESTEKQSERTESTEKQSESTESTEEQGGTETSSSEDGSENGNGNENPNPLPVGAKFTDSKTKISYKVTKNGKKPQVTVTAVHKSVRKVTVPQSVKYNKVSYQVTAIAAKAFKGKNVTSVTIGSNVVTIGNNAFENCKKLQTVTIGKNVTSIGNSAFAGCTVLKKVTIPNKVKTIGNKAFYNDKKLASCTMGTAVTKIGTSAFEKCPKLKKITIKSKKITKVGKKAFKGIHARAAIKVPASKLKAYKKLFKGKGQGKAVTIKK